MDVIKDFLLSVGFKVDGVGSVDAASDALNRLAESAERAAKALSDLEGKSHGGISIRAVGHLVQVEIKPTDQAA